LGNDHSQQGIGTRYAALHRLWEFKSEEGLAPNAYTHALFADFHLAGQK